MKVKRQIIAGLAVCLGLLLGFGLIFAQKTLAAEKNTFNYLAVQIPIERVPELTPTNFPVWWDEPDQASAQYGQSVRSAGDVNGDGYDDMIVGTHAYNHGATQSGGAWLYYGTPAGFSITHDVDITLPVVTTSGFFGWAVGSANVNGDAYDDIMVSLINYDNSYADEGAVFVWYGSENGPGASYDWMARGNAQYAHLGWDLGSAGDVNNDGYEDIIVGAVRYDYNNISHAYVWYGSENGLDPDGSRPVGLPGNSDWQASAPTNETWSNPIWAGHGFGSRVGTAGDVNGDSYSDVFVGAPLYDNGSTELEEGAVFVWYSSETGLGDPGTIGNADWSAESDQAGAKLTGVNYNPLCGAGTVGDINNDGYDDFIVGSHLYSDTATQEGIALLYLGSMDGLDPDGSRPVGNPENSDWLAVSNQSYAGLGYEFGESGDLNNDGYDDILLSSYGYDITGTPGITNGGIGLVWFGGAQLPMEDGIPNNADVMFYSGNTGEYLGESIAWGGDVNGDGFDDVIAGAPFYSSNLGRAYLFYLALPILDLSAYNDSPTMIGHSTTLSATISAGTLVSYTWDFGDDFMGAGQVVSHTYQMWGSYTATVTASNPVTTTFASTVVTIEPLRVYLPLIQKVVP